MSSVSRAFRCYLLGPSIGPTIPDGRLLKCRLLILLSDLRGRKFPYRRLTPPTSLPYTPTRSGSSTDRNDDITTRPTQEGTLWPRVVCRGSTGTLSYRETSDRVQKTPGEDPCGTFVRKEEGVYKIIWFSGKYWKPLLLNVFIPYSFINNETKTGCPSWVKLTVNIRVWLVNVGRSRQVMSFNAVSY